MDLFDHTAAILSSIVSSSGQIAIMGCLGGKLVCIFPLTFYDSYLTIKFKMAAESPKRSIPCHSRENKGTESPYFLLVSLLC